MLAATATQPSSSRAGNGEPLDPAALRLDFPVLGEKIGRRNLVYLDSAATAQKPRAVIDRLFEFYTREYAKINESHTLSRQATWAYEGAREKVARLIHAARPAEVIFMRGATEGLSTLAQAFSDGELGRRDEVLVTAAEHHANLIPWQIACRRSGATLRAAPVTADGAIDLEAFERLLSRRTKVVAVTHVSNVTGIITPVKRIVELAHARDVPVVVDAAQSLPHLPVDVQDLGCDFLAASGHKIGAPSGTGFLYGRAEWLERLRPQEGGSGMAETVTLDGPPTYKPLPHRFEAGTPAFAEVIALGAAVDYWTGLGLERIKAYVAGLLNHVAEKLGAVPGVRILGADHERIGLLSFTLEGRDPVEVDRELDRRGIAVRGGTLSAQPLIQALGLPGAVRASFQFYNTRREADALVRAVAAIAAGQE